MDLLFSSSAPPNYFSFLEILAAVTMTERLSLFCNFFHHSNLDCATTTPITDLQSLSDEDQEKLTIMKRNMSGQCC